MKKSLFIFPLLGLFVICFFALASCVARPINSVVSETSDGATSSFDESSNEQSNPSTQSNISASTETEQSNPSTQSDIPASTETEQNIYYTITFKDYDGEELQLSSVKKGDMPTYNKSNPTRDNDDTYSYTFSGWTPTISVANGDAIYVATYSSQLLGYNVTINLDGGTSSVTNLQFRANQISKDILPFDVKKRGYTFKGYSLNNVKVYDENGNSVNYFQPSTNMTFKAIYEEAVTLTIYYTLYNPKTGQIIKTLDTKPTDMGNVSETRSYNYNTYVDLFSNPAEGYTFVGWYNEGQVLSNENEYRYMMWDEDFTMEARFEYTLYDLKVWSNNIDLGQVMIRNGNSQVFYDVQTLKEYYTEPVTIVAYSKTDIRFLGWYDENNKLVSTNAVYTFDMENEDYTLEAKWNYFTITYDLDGGINDLSNPSYYTIDSPKINLKTPERAGYTFQGWEYESNTITEISTESICHMKLIAKWSVSTITPYRVEHYLQNIIDDDYPLTPYETDNLTGTTDTLTNGSVKTYEGFTSPSITQVNIDGDGSTVIKLQYTRNSYTVTLLAGNDKLDSITITGDGTYKYEKEVTISITNPGYVFEGWYNGEKLVSNYELYTFNMLAKDLVYTAKWSASTHTPYKVEHYLQNITDDDYPSTPYEIDDLEGTTDTLTNGSVKTYEGFTSPSITQVNIDGNGNTVIKLYYIRNSYRVSLSKNIVEAGTVTGDGIYKYGKQITLDASIKNKGYTFVGWYKNNELYRKVYSINYFVGTSNELEARYIINKYSITIDNQVEGVIISGVSSGEKYEYNSDIIISATNIPIGCTIKWTRSDNGVAVSENYSFKMPFDNITITITAMPYTREQNKIYFGTYPQSRVIDDILIDELNTIAGELPTSTNKYSWTDYNYYIEGNITSYMYYQDIDYDNNGTCDYRGVYFTSYRPYYCSVISKESNSSQDDNGYITNIVYWFSFDPIEWSILTEDKTTGQALIVSNLILDDQEFFPVLTYEQFEHNGGTGYANNYELSSIRMFLNEDFYNTAFNELQKLFIETTTVNNGSASAGQTSDKYACNNTNDKIFMLSYKEVTIYYTSNSARQTSGTDYAKIQGLSVISGYSGYWLRSPNYSEDFNVYTISSDGKILYNQVRYTNGLRPACHIDLY